MDFKSIKTATLLGAFAISILGSTALSGTAQASPYDGSGDWSRGDAGGWGRANVWSGWYQGGTEAAYQRKRRVAQGHAHKLRRHVAQRHRVRTGQEQYSRFDAGYGPSHMDERYPDARSNSSMESERPSRRTRRVRADRAHASASPAMGGFGSDLVSEARRYIGGNPTGRSSLWCGAFMDLILQRTGHRPGSNLARDYAQYGQRVSGPQVGAIAVMGRRGGGHVGVVSGIDSNGNPIIISGNHGHRVAEATYSAGRVYAYVMP